MQKETAHATAAPAGRMRLVLIVGAVALLASLVLLARAAVSGGDRSPSADRERPPAAGATRAVHTRQPRAEAPRLRGPGEVRKMPYGDAPFAPSRPPAPAGSPDLHGAPDSATH